ncbi:hypothetical protein SDRG_16826 [Saprolegnia diclina VS20]|uniref:CWH43-like N-terminal domain-containing protein n=1 Tax=Saprolegnia diclina (strain VS20) TaxID=1156394 RepID=T0PIV1_SAPDV|nr:hypothetical protein SDRG_16826 [Saprolegnia diclina VS20]EQC25304.1 hypothetical protein SDRG_16826 [Saprolegnia diclina VS20]|eukprot:XP_008621270.1 hypothetical protein SDRG_16826 [Saprolegnia diclina VS20]
MKQRKSTPVAAPPTTPATKAAPAPAFFSVGLLPTMIPVSGLLTMAATMVYTCQHHYKCTETYPTLSTAAMAHPQFYVFGIGMNLTSYFIFLTISLLTTYIQEQRNMTKYAWVYYVWGLLTSSGLTVLCTFDMKRWRNTHIISTIFFFVSSWIMMIMAQIARLRIASPAHAYHVKWGSFFIGLGVFLTSLFGFFYVTVHGYIANPYGLTYSQEALLELVSIVCQLLYMGTLSSEVGSLQSFQKQRPFLRAMDYVALVVLIAAVFAVEWL